MSRKRQKEKDTANRESGSMGAATLAAALSVVLGVLLGAFNLAMLPVSEVRELPPEGEQKPNVVYFVQGQERGGNSYRVKEGALLQGTVGTLILNEEELNSWSRNSFNFGAPTPDEQDAGGSIQIKPTAPRFRIRDGIFNMSMTMEVKAFGQSKKVLVHSDGTFAQEGGTWVFSPESTYIGSARVPAQILAPMLRDKMIGLFESAQTYDQLHNSWSSLETVEVDENELVLIRK